MSQNTNLFFCWEFKICFEVLFTHKRSPVLIQNLLKWRLIGDLSSCGSWMQFSKYFLTGSDSIRYLFYKIKHFNKMQYVIVFLHKSVWCRREIQKNLKIKPHPSQSHFGKQQRCTQQIFSLSNNANLLSDLSLKILVLYSHFFSYKITINCLAMNRSITSTRS